MQRKLFIIRHGKSSWESIVNDIDRPLTERGVNNSYEMARRMKGENLVPGLIISSPANRAFHTAMIMAKIWDLPDHTIQISNKLYLPDENAILSLLFETPDEINALAIYGHNPGFTDFANRFLDTPLENLPTAGVVVVTMEMESWTDIVNCKVIEVKVDCPKKQH